MPKKYEKEAVLFIAFLSILLSAFFVELYPFSLNPLFTRSANQMTYVSVVDEKKRPISPMALGVHLQYESAYEIQGIKPKDSVVKFGEDINDSEIVSRVRKEGAKFRFIREFDIEIKKIYVSRLF